MNFEQPENENNTQEGIVEIKHVLDVNSKEIEKQNANTFEIENIEDFKSENDKKEKIERFDYRSEKVMRMIEAQIDMPRSEWRDDFKSLIENIKKEKTTEDKNWKETTIENRLKEKYEIYLNDFNLEEEKLKDKRILDIGCSDAQFVLYCLENGISEDVFGVDINKEKHFEKLESAKNDSIDAKQAELLKRHDKKIYEINYYNEDLPQRNLDYILARALYFYMVTTIKQYKM